MAVVLVTVAGPSGRLDLVVPADVPVADLLEPLAAAHGVRRPETASGDRSSSGDWSLRPLGADPLDTRESLTAGGVVDGDVIVLRVGDQPVARPPRSPPGRPGAREPIATPRPERSRAPIVAVLSATAGTGRTGRTGRTSAATLLAGALAARTGQATVAVDAHPAAVDAQPDAESLSEPLVPDRELTAGDLLALIDHPALTREELLGCIAWRGPRLGRVASGRGRGPPLGDRGWRRLLRGLAEHGLTLVVDCAPGLGDPGTRAAAAAADQLVLLVEPEPSEPTRILARALADRGVPVVAVARPAEVARVAEVLAADWVALGLAVPPAGG